MYYSRLFIIMTSPLSGSLTNTEFLAVPLVAQLLRPVISQLLPLSLELIPNGHTRMFMVTHVPPP